MSSEQRPLRPRNITLRKAHAFLRAAGRRVSPKEIADHFGVDKSAMTQAEGLWNARATGVRVGRDQKRRAVWFAYEPPTSNAKYEPIAPSIEELEAEIAELRKLLGERRASGVQPDGSAGVPPWA